MSQDEMRELIERRISSALAEAIRDEMLSPVKKSQADFIDHLAIVALAAATHDMVLVKTEHLEDLIKAAKANDERD